MNINSTYFIRLYRLVFFTGIFLMLMFFYSCNKTEIETEYVDDVNFTALQIEKDSIYAGEETKIKAVATGTNIEFFWSATKGDILGSGNEIIYASSPCHIGTNTITCTVKNNSENAKTKTVKVVVLE